jgi:hypothetical protein
MGVGLPRVWISVEDSGDLVVHEQDHPDGIPVEMNASLYRQIKAATKNYFKFQRVLERMYSDAVEHPDRVRRVR